MRVSEIMTKNPATCSLDATVQDAARTMAERDIGFLPIVDGKGEVIGTVTDRDIVIRVVAKGLDAKSSKLRDFGGNQVISLSPDDDLSRAKELMQDNQVQRILVCEAKKPVGVISLQDLSKGTEQSELGQTVREVKQEGASSIH
ncbi:MAG TPA: CBS domain-containing protein [Myxococcales bacterium]|jgi:CBS domain-containing protein|nr:CBS domain-containing protein [Myxococcales bacterium]